MSSTVARRAAQSATIARPLASSVLSLCITPLGVPVVPAGEGEIDDLVGVRSPAAAACGPSMAAGTRQRRERWQRPSSARKATTFFMVDTDLACLEDVRLLCVGAVAGLREQRAAGDASSSAAISPTV